MWGGTQFYPVVDWMQEEELAVDKKVAGFKWTKLLVKSSIQYTVNRECCFPIKVKL